MSLEITSTHAAYVERRRVAPDSLIHALSPIAGRVTPREWDLLLELWEQLQPYADRFASAFFDTLFARAPELRPYFVGASLAAQFLQFAHLVTGLVSAHGDRVELRRRTEGIVLRMGGGQNGESAVRAAVAALLDEVSASGMPSEVRSSWRSAYISLAATLRRAARRPGHETAAAA